MENSKSGKSGSSGSTIANSKKEIDPIKTMEKKKKALNQEKADKARIEAGSLAHNPHPLQRGKRWPIMVHTPCLSPESFGNALSE